MTSTGDIMVVKSVRDAWSCSKEFRSRRGVSARSDFGYRRSRWQTGVWKASSCRRHSKDDRRRRGFWRLAEI